MATPKKETLLDWYRQMVLIRRFEERCAELYQQGLIGGFLHLYIGQEATGVGAVAALREQDHVITAYRDHGIALARGLDPKAVMAEMLGKRTGVSGGKGGSMHLADRERADTASSAGICLWPPESPSKPATWSRMRSCWP